MLHRFPFHIPYDGFQPTLSIEQMVLLCLSTVLIAAAGYMINDYFDMGVDTINKPQKVIVERVFSRRRIISWHVILNVLAMGVAVWIYGSELRLPYLSVPIFSMLLLIFYSTTLKRNLIVGNVSIALLTSLTVFNATLFEPEFHFFEWSERRVLVMWLYVGFAFLITFIREVIKDIEDMKGDSAIECKTIPLVFGVNTAKRIVLIFAILLILFILAAMGLKSEWNIGLASSWIAGIILPLSYCMVLLYRYNTQEQFHRLSAYIKWITLVGILSMMFI